MNVLEISRSDLLQTAVIAVLTYICIQMFIKPSITKVWKEKWWHDLATNVTALIVAILLAIGGLYVNALIGNPRDFVWAIYQGIIATFAATFGYEVLKNATKFVANK